jgi:hypothetical protein
MQAVKISELKRGDLFRWDPSALEKGESPEETWVVIEEGRAFPDGGRTGVQVSPLGTGLTFVPINTVGWDWLAVPTGEHVAGAR